MDRLITLRTELESEIQRQGYSLSSFSKASGINRGILSATLNSNPPKPMSINQLDGMVKALGKPEGWLYEQFVEECFNESGKANWRRVRPLLLRCLDLHRIDLIRRTLDLLMENPAHVSHVFEMAEELVAQERGADAVPLYQCVIENERNYQSERLAISQYRLFRAALGHNIEDNLKAALIFESFRNRLPAHLKLDALLKLGNIYFTVQDWDALLLTADELFVLADSLYQYNRKHSRAVRKQPYPPAERPLVFYYAQSFILKFAGYELTARYDLAHEALKGFSDLSWFEDNHPEHTPYVERLELVAYFNKLNLMLLEGNDSCLPEYLKLMRTYPGEILPSLMIIIQAAAEHGFNIDHILEEHYDLLYPDDIVEPLKLGKITNQHYSDIAVGISRYISIYYHLTLYQCNRNFYDQRLEKILASLESVVEKYNRGRILDCLNLLRKLRDLKHI
ncbi:DNA-binding protein [Paenibacillus kandeliae]|uniref:DNA-binding protein n=1 Tax=Paenibacillus kandeliae TaxID=3231269 RepID=UPI003459F22A